MGVSTWEELTDLANPGLRILVEAVPRSYYPTGSNWTSEGLNTYSHPCKEVKVTAVTDDGQEMTKKDNFPDVQTTPGSWWFDKTNQTLYVRCFDDDDLSSAPVDTVVVAFVWKMFSTDACEFNGVQYMPIVRQDSFPMLDISVDNLVEGAYKFNFGSFKMNNPGWFDKAAEDYLWTYAKILIKLGGEDLPYDEHISYFVGRISDYFVKDEEVIFTVKDIRVGAYAQLPVDHYWESNYQESGHTVLESGAEGRAIPIFYGIKKHIIPTCINTKRVMEPYGEPPYLPNSVWKIADSRKIKEITEIRLNFGDVDYPYPDCVLVEDTHYTVDLNNAEFTLILAFQLGWTLEVDAKGFVDGGSVLMEKGGTIAKDILKTYLGFVDDDLDLSSFTETDTERPYEQCLYLDMDKSSRLILQTIGRGVIAFFTPVESGKLALEVYLSEVPADTMKLEDRDFGEGWEVKIDDSFLRNKVKVQYDQSPKTQEFKVVEKSNMEVLYKYEVRETLTLETYLREKSDAEIVAQAVQNMCSSPIKVVDTSCGIKAFKLFPTRKVKITRKRAVDSSGAWDEKVFRIRQIIKNTSLEQTRIVVADDFQSLGDVPHQDSPHSHTPHSHSAHSHTPHTHSPYVDSLHTHVPHSNFHQDIPYEDHLDDYHRDKPYKDTPHQDTPHTHTSHGHTPHDHTPHTHTPYSDSPHTHVPHEDTPHIHTG